MTPGIVLLVFFALLTKHFICDFLLQWRYQWSNKGTYGHPGGILHSAICAFGTFAGLLLTLTSTIIASSTLHVSTLVTIALVEGIIHYHIDWAKMNTTKYFQLGPLTSEKFWWLLGFDQWLHHITYVGIVGYLIAVT